MCLSAELIPKSFIDDMLQPVTNADGVGDGKAAAVINISPEKRSELIEKLRRALADDEECAVSLIYPCIHII